MNIFCNISVEGFHRWKDAKDKLPEVSFLSDRHRHIFHICCKKTVHHDDRDEEFILFKRKILAFLNKRYGTSIITDPAYRHLEFGDMSCEMIAKELIKEFDLESCIVSEDGENGCEATKDDLK